MYPSPAQVVEEQLIKDIQYAKRMSDIVIVSFHWGEELNFIHTERQRELAYLAINNGAKIVIGHHPHVLQRLEMYNEGLIAYSLGNFVSHTYEPLTKESVILVVTIKNTTIENFDHIPIVINQDYQPVEKAFLFLDFLFFTHLFVILQLLNSLLNSLFVFP